MRFVKFPCTPVLYLLMFEFAGEYHQINCLLFS
jgi:hypothetical protein